MSNFAKRAIFGALFVGIVILCLYLGFGPSSFLFSVAGIIGLVEATRMTWKGRKGAFGWHLTGGAFLAFGFYLFTENVFPFVMMSCIFNLALVVQLFKKKQNLLTGSRIDGLVGMLYAVIPFIALLIFIDHKEPIVLLGVLIAIWSNDTFAYLIGKQFGRRKLFERISPNKTWEGSIGGAAVALLLVVLVLPMLFEQFNKVDWLFIGILSIIFGSIGDLIESMFKRYYGVKDSGNVIPGHGGILDRFDALMGAAPFVLAYCYLADYLG